ncbi:hypothetical protein Hanom_Chr07g00588131 [Helianthus anomalus]
MIDVAKVSSQILKESCFYKCIIAFANRKDVNENLRKIVLDGEIQLERIKKDFKSQLIENDQEICMFKHEYSNTKDQLQTMIEKYQGCKKELESTQINCEKWVESCVGFEMFLNKE